MAVYPRLGTVPREVWLRLFGSAQHEISLLDHRRRPLAGDRDVGSVLAERARAGVRVRICLAEAGDVKASARRDANTSAADVDGGFELYAPLRDSGEAEIRLHQGVLYNFIYRADDQLLVAQRVYGVPAAQAPVLHLQQAEGGDMFTTYLQSFERSWADAHPPGWLNRAPPEIEEP